MATIMDVLTQEGSFTSLVKALKQAKLDATLRGTGPYTIFAPTNDAIDALPDRHFVTWQSDQAKLTKVLNFHIIAGRYSAADLLDYHFLKTLEGQRVRIGSRLDDVGYTDTTASDAYGYVMGGTLSVAIAQTITINGAAITRADIDADNGFIHTIDHVLVPWLLGLTK